LRLFQTDSSWNLISFTSHSISIPTIHTQIQNNKVFQLSSQTTTAISKGKLIPIQSKSRKKKCFSPQYSQCGPKNHTNQSTQIKWEKNNKNNHKSIESKSNLNVFYPKSTTYMSQINSKTFTLIPDDKPRMIKKLATMNSDENWWRMGLVMLPLFWCIGWIIINLR